MSGSHTTRGRGLNVVEVYVGYLRRKLGRDVIETVRGAGYRAPERRQLMRRWSRVGLRARLTLIATAALAVGLVAGSLLLLHGFATSRLHAIDGSSRTVAANVANLAAAGALPPTLPVQAGQSAQVLTATGAVLAVSPGTSHTLPLVPMPSGR